MRDILIIDTGVDIVGIYSIIDRKYTAYRDTHISQALKLIENAEEVVTYNGNRYDLYRLSEFAGYPKSRPFPLMGIHADMREIIWGNRILGSNLIDTYKRHFSEVPKFSDTYEGSNECDVYMTLKLWECWKSGKLKILDGQQK